MKQKMYKFGLKKLKIKNKVYWVREDLNGTTTVYNNKSMVVLSYKIHKLNLCSLSGILQDINILEEYRDVAKDIFHGILINPPYRREVAPIVSYQNVTKSGYDLLLELGFTDYCRLPGAYANGRTKVSYCVSIMVYTSKDMKDSTNKSIELLKLIKG